MEFTASQLARVLNGTIEGDPQAKVTDFAKIEHGKAGQLCFFANPKYEEYVYTCEASILLVNKDFVPKQPVKPTLIRVENSYEALSTLLKYAADNRKRFVAIAEGERDGIGVRNSARVSTSEAIPMLAETSKSEITPESTRMSTSATGPKSARIA